jgi:KDO2-lipid IV(A) lauroyltransferase
MPIFRDPRLAYWVRDPLWGAFYHAAYRAIRLLPCATASGLGARLGLVEGRLRFAALQSKMARCLSLIRPDIPPSQHASLMRAMWQNVGRVHSEMAVLDRLWDAADITLVNARALSAAKRSGRPIIAAFCHLGNWELLAAAIQRQGIALNVVYENLANRFENRLAEKARRGLGYRLIPPTRRGVRDLYGALRRREAVGMAMDEFKNGRVIAPAFGRPWPASSNLGYALRLARRFDALVLPMYCVRTGPLSFALTFLHNRANPDPEQLNALCESWIRSHPEQWYMLWRLSPDGLVQRGNKP